MRSFGLMTRLVLAALAATPALGEAAPGDRATSQSTYPAIRKGANQLVMARDALKTGDKIFEGHRAAAIRLINEALGELDEAVKFADARKQPGEKGTPIFDADRGQLAATQGKYLAIRGGAKHVIEAGKALDQGLDKFGGHRVKALRALNRALDELETAVKSAR